MSSITLRKRIINIPEAPVIITTIGLALILGGIQPKFFYPGILAGMLSYASELGIMVVGVALLLIAGEFDLSVGATFQAAGAIMLWGVLIGMHPLMAVGLALTAGIVIGLCNGFITQKTGVSSLIVTLGVMFFLRGITLFFTGGFPLTVPLDFPTDFLYFEIFNGLLPGGNFRAAGVWFLVVAAITTIGLVKTRFGNHILASGGDRNVATALGVRVFRTKLATYTITAFLAAFAGVVSASRYRYVLSGATLGSQALEAVAASVIGGVALFGGRGSLIGASIGAFLMGMVRLGLILAGIDPFWYEAFIGIVLIVAASVNVLIFKQPASFLK